MHFTGFNGSTSVIANVPIGGVLIHTRTAHDEQKLVLQGINIYGKGRQATPKLLLLQLILYSTPTSSTCNGCYTLSRKKKKI